MNVHPLMSRRNTFSVIFSQVVKTRHYYKLLEFRKCLNQITSTTMKSRCALIDPCDAWFPFKILLEKFPFYVIIATLESAEVKNCKMKITEFQRSQRMVVVAYRPFQ